MYSDMNEIFAQLDKCESLKDLQELVKNTSVQPPNLSNETVYL